MILSFIGVGEGFTLTFDGEGCGVKENRRFSTSDRMSPQGARDSHSPSMERGVGTLASPQGARDSHSPSMERGVGTLASPLFSPMR